MSAAPRDQVGSTPPPSPPQVPKRRTRSALIHYAQGLLMGGADIIPGVSGGTMALIVGIYERLIASVRAAAGAPVALLKGDRNGFEARWRQVEWGLVLPLAAGILSAIVVGANVIPPLLERYPVGMRAFFFGLILGSVAIPWRRIERPETKHYVAAVVGAMLAFIIVGLPPREVLEPPLLAVFGAASVAICAMILPGVSGAFLLLVLGVYEATLHALTDLNLPYIAVFAAGAAVGLGLFSRLLHYLLQTWHDATMAVLVGLMVGSLRALWPYLDEDRGMMMPPLDSGLLIVVGLAAIGFGIVTALTYFGRIRDSDSAGH